MRKKKDNGKLTESDLQELSIALLSKRAELLGDVRSMEDEVLRRDSSEMSRIGLHMADAGSDNYHLENTLGLVGSEITLLKEIDAALRRMNEGTYGCCEGDMEVIPKARLDAIPWARFCVKCASLKESKRTAEQRIARAYYDLASGVDDDVDERDVYPPLDSLE